MKLCYLIVMLDLHNGMMYGVKRWKKVDISFLFVFVINLKILSSGWREIPSFIPYIFPLVCTPLPEQFWYPPLDATRKRHPLRSISS